MIVLDTSFVFALLDENDSHHQQATAWYVNEKTESFTTTPLVLAEIDHLLNKRAGSAVVKAFHADVRTGSLGVEWWPKLELEAAEIADRYAALGLGLTDASLVALAGRLETSRIASFDERHFRAVEPLNGGSSFQLLPADA
ncbi:MAG TPA: PIN domain-containing protein [Solirubrobacterales bacterium]|nr:PIN domain-containing protein [Solirubrobacterales bacterium]